MSRPEIYLTNVQADASTATMIPERQNLPINELVGYTSVIGSKPIARITRSASLGNIDKVTRWLGTVENLGSFTFYTKTKHIDLAITENGSYEKLLFFLRKNFIPDLRIKSHKIYKVNAKMYIDRPINLDGLGTRLNGSKYIPELHAGLSFTSDGLSFMMYTNGTVLVTGPSKLSVYRAPRIIKKVIGNNVVGIFKYDKENVSRIMQGLNIQPSTKTKPLPTLNRKKMEMLNARYPPTASGSFVNANIRRNLFGYPNRYVRPGPNKVARLYKLGDNIPSVRSKAIIAYANAGVNMPTVVKQLLGITGNVAVPVKKASNANRRAPHWDAVKNGFYVRPGRGGQPYFKAMPKDPKTAKQGIVNAYKGIGKNIPANVRTKFRITNKIETKVHRPVINNNRINGRKYSRYTKAELVRMARNLGNEVASDKLSLTNLFNRIKNKSGVSSTTSNNVFNVNGVPHVLLSGGKVKRDKKSRAFNTLLLNERKKIARASLKNNAMYEKMIGLPAKDWFKFLYNNRQQALNLEKELFN